MLFPGSRASWKALSLHLVNWALEPCSAGAVVTNPNTGEVLACVSYPGYDNNRLSNVMDRSYYVQLSMGYVTDLLQQSDPGEDSTRFYL